MLKCRVLETPDWLRTSRPRNQHFVQAPALESPRSLRPISPGVTPMHSSRAQGRPPLQGTPFSLFPGPQIPAPRLQPRFPRLVAPGYQERAWKSSKCSRPGRGGAQCQRDKGKNKMRSNCRFSNSPPFVRRRGAGGRAPKPGLSAGAIRAPRRIINRASQGPGQRRPFTPGAPPPGILSFLNTAASWAAGKRRPRGESAPGALSWAPARRISGPGSLGGQGARGLF